MFGLRYWVFVILATSVCAVPVPQSDILPIPGAQDIISEETTSVDFDALAEILRQELQSGASASTIPVSDPVPIPSSGSSNLGPAAAPISEDELFASLIPADDKVVPAIPLTPATNDALSVPFPANKPKIPVEQGWLPEFVTEKEEMGSSQSGDKTEILDKYEGHIHHHTVVEEVTEAVTAKIAEEKVEQASFEAAVTPAVIVEQTAKAEEKVDAAVEVQPTKPQKPHYHHYHHHSGECDGSEEKDGDWHDHHGPHDYHHGHDHGHGHGYHGGYHGQHFDHGHHFDHDHHHDHDHDHFHGMHNGYKKTSSWKEVNKKYGGVALA